MMNFITDLKSAAHKRAAYHRTVAELESLPLNTALDLDIYRGDARTIARKAVYGN